MNTFNSTIFSKTILSLGALLRMAGFFLIFQAIGVILSLQWIQIPSDYAAHPEKLALIPNIQVILATTQGLGMFFGLIVLPLLYIKFFRSNETPTDLFHPIPHQTLFIAVSIILLLLSLPLIEQFTLWNKGLSLPDSLKSLQHFMEEKEKLAAIATDILVQYNGPITFLWIFIVVAVLPAVGEELVFRGIFQNELIKIGNNKHFAIWASGFVFSFIHFQFFGFVPRMLLGVLFGYCYLWTNSLWVPIAMHFINNALSLILSIFFKEFLSNASEQANTLFDIRFFIAYIVVQVVFIFLYYTFIHQQKMKGSHGQ